MTSICMCGAEAGYPHEPECPFKLFAGGAFMEDRWREQAGDNVIRLAALAHTVNNPGHRVFRGSNFVECQTCGKHAHLGPNVLFLEVHGRPEEGKPVRIRAAQF